MSTELGKAYVQIVPSAEGISGSIEKSIRPEASSAGTSAGKSIASGISNALSKSGKALMKGGAIATGLSVPIVAGISEALDAYSVQEEAETKLIEIYKTRMGVSEEAARKTIELAGALQKQGVIGDEVAISGAQQLATFAQYPETINTLLPAMENLLVQQNGLSSTTQDATSVANLMGKALMGQTGALTRCGITFTDAQKKVLKYGTEEEKAATLAEVITQNVGNMNEVMGQTDGGKIQQLKNTLGDIVEEVGAALMPIVSQLAEFVSSTVVPKIQEFVAFMQANPVFAKIAVGLAAVLAVGGPVTTMIGGIISAMSVLIGPIGAVVAIVGTLVAAFKHLWDTNEGFRKAITDIWNGIQAKCEEFTQGIIDRLNELGFNFESMTDVLKAVWEGFCDILAPIFEGAFSAVSAALGYILDAITGILDVFIGIFTGDWTQFWNGIKEIFSAIWNGITGVFTAVMDTIKGVTDAVLGWFGTSWGEIWNSVSSTFSGIWNGIVSFFTNAWDTAVNTFTQTAANIGKVVDKIKAVFKSLGQSIKTIFTNIKNTIHNIWNGIKSTLGSVVDGIKTKIQNTFNNVKNTVTNIFGGIKTKAKGIWDGIKSTIVNAIDAAKNKIKGIVDKIKGFFNIKIKFPHVPLPHFSISPSGWKVKDLLHGSIPSLGIKWYAKGGIMDKPTLFGGGEAGPEAIMPLDPFWAKLDRMADNIVNGVATVTAATAGGGTGDIHLDVYLYPSGPKMGEHIVKTYDTYKRRLG